MASWRQVTEEAPDLAEVVQKVFDARRHKTLATLRKDGSPRISGLECEFDDGEVRFGMMDRSMKAFDIARDPRIAIHATSDDPKEGEDPTVWGGDAKIAGTALESGPQGFRVDVTEVVYIRVGTPADHLVIDSWHEGRGRTTAKRL